MNYRALGRTGLNVSIIGLGALEIGRAWGIRSDEDPGLPPDEATASRFLNHVLDSGVNFIDTAAAYWASEERIGNAISHRRSEYVLASKWGEWCDETGSVYDYSPAAFWDFLESSLKKLKTDCIDLFQIHSAPMDVIREGAAVEEMKKARQQGKIRFIGASVGEPEAVAAIQTGDYDAIQISYSVLDRQMEERVLPMAREHNIGVIIKDALAAGRLTAKIGRLPDEQHEELRRRVEMLKDMGGSWAMTLPEFALRFIMASQAVSTIIVGTRSELHFDQNLNTADGRGLSEEQMMQLRRYLEGT